MSTILFQGSNGALGDIFFASHPMVHFKRAKGYKVFVAIPENLKPEVRGIYDCHTFLDGIHVVPDIGDKFLIPYASKLGVDLHLFLQDVSILSDNLFYPLDQWFRNPASPTLDTSSCIGLQVASTSNWTRPQIPHFRRYLDLIKSAGLKPLFLGGAKDEELFLTYYPWGKDYCLGEEYWRFGKDSLLQTMANVRDCRGLISFSSWTAYIACLQGVPTLDLWNLDQWHVYTPLVRRFLGNPVHYLQDRFDTPPLHFLIEDTFVNFKRIGRVIHKV